MSSIGRPEIHIDDHELESLMSYNPSLADTAAFFRCSESTIARHINEKWGVPFAEFREQRMVRTRLTLVQQALTRASKSDILLIFSLKNICGWKDKMEIGMDQDKPFRLSYDPQALKNFVEQGGGADDQG